MTSGERKLVLAAIDGGIATITLNRPERHNSLVPALLRDLGGAIAYCEAEAGAKVLVLRAAGRSFSTGGDLRGFHERAEDVAQYADTLVGLLNDVIVRLFDCRLPVITVVNGQVTGGAMGLVLASDIVLVTDRASFTPYYAATGFAPDGAWTALLPDIIGRTRASSVLILDQTISAEQALAWGLATAHADVDGLEQAVTELCERILDKKAGSIVCTRQLLRPTDLERRLELERERFVRQIVTAEAMAGIKGWLGGG